MTQTALDRAKSKYPEWWPLTKRQLLEKAGLSEKEIIKILEADERKEEEDKRKEADKIIYEKMRTVMENLHSHKGKKIEIILRCAKENEEYKDISFNNHIKDEVMRLWRKESKECVEDFKGIYLEGYITTEEEECDRELYRLPFISAGRPFMSNEAKRWIVKITTDDGEIIYENPELFTEKEYPWEEGIDYRNYRRRKTFGTNINNEPREYWDRNIWLDKDSGRYIS